MKPYFLMGALLLVSSSAMAAETSPKNDGWSRGFQPAPAAAKASRPVNALDGAGRVTQSFGSHLSNAGVAVHDASQRFQTAVERRVDRAEARVDTAMARGAADMKNAGQSFATGMNKFGLSTRARWDAFKTATGNKLVQAGTTMAAGSGYRFTITPPAKLYAGRTETKYRPNGAKYFITRVYQADSRGRLAEVMRAGTVKQAPTK